jgi:hypothetical protein
MKDGIVGMYVHQHWPYHHPYAARTWSLEDWRGYATGLRDLGFNALLIWPVIETMPAPLLPGDRANLEKLGQVIDLLHHKLEMRVYLALCPNVVAHDEVAARASFARRHFFYCDRRVDPADRQAMAQMMRRREEALGYLRNADGIAVIDSDPGGYPGSTNEEFVELLAAHRALFDRLRPGIELIYWMHAGWEAYCRFYQTGQFAMGTDAEFSEALSLLKARNPEPWGLANGLHCAESLGLAGRVILFSYGAIEGEPSFPLTNFGGEGAHRAGGQPGPRGVMGNAQTHCVQLPNTFAFARGAQGKPVGEDDYAAFAERLIRGRGRNLVRAWQALAGGEPELMLEQAALLEGWAGGKLEAGDLRGLLLGSAERLVRDLVLQLRFKAHLEEFCAAVAAGRSGREELGCFSQAADTWQAVHGYENRWWCPPLTEALRQLRSPVLDQVLDFEAEGSTPFGQVQADYLAAETHTPRLLAAMRRYLA